MKLIIRILLPLLLLTSCVDSLEDYNVDKKFASQVPAQALFSNAQKSLSDILTTPSVASNNYRLFVQYWTTTTYLDEPRYNMTARAYSENFWNAVYRNSLSDLKRAKELIDADVSLVPEVKNNQLALVGILEVYAWSLLVNTFGSVPYTEALSDLNLQPKYDDAKAIYSDMFTRLNASIALLTPGVASFGTADLFYNGTAANWVKFGNSLKLRMAMTIADEDPANAKRYAEEAASSLDKLIQSNATNVRFPYVAASPNNNPISANLNPIFSSREDFVVADKIVNEMNTRNDPRRPFYFTQVEGQYIGGVYGFSNDFLEYSHPSDKIIAPTFEGLLMDYSEVEFLLAEAVERNFIIASGTAEEHYNKAITASILYWGGTAAEAAAYLAQPSVAYGTAGANYKEKIGTQKWIALNNRGWDAWVEWRRLDYPVLTPPMASLSIPVRMIYPVKEQNLNGTQWTQAITTHLGGQDSPDVKIFWDKN